MTDTLADILREIPRAVVSIGITAFVCWTCYILMGV